MAIGLRNRFKVIITSLMRLASLTILTYTITSDYPRQTLTYLIKKLPGVDQKYDADKYLSNVLTVIVFFICWIIISVVMELYSVFIESIFNRIKNRLDLFKTEVSEIRKFHSRYARQHKIAEVMLGDRYTKDEWFYYIWLDSLLSDIRAAFIVLLNHPEVRVALFVFDNIEGEEKLILSQTSADRKMYEIAFKKGEGFCGYVWSTGKTQAGSASKLRVFRKLRRFTAFGQKPFEKLFTDHRYVKTERGIDDYRSYICFPVRTKSNKIIGVISVDSRNSRDFMIYSRTISEIEEIMSPLYEIFVDHIVSKRYLKNDKTPIEMYLDERSAAHDMEKEERSTSSAK